MAQPNIINFLSDQHHFDKSRFIGDEYAITPNLDALAKNGVVMDACYCNSPLCVPCRSSMLSRLLPGWGI